MTDKTLKFPLESSPKTKFSRSLFQISQSTNHGPHELNVRRTKKVQIELEPNKETTFSLFRINEELLGQMKQMQYQMMKMNGAAGPDNGSSVQNKKYFQLMSVSRRRYDGRLLKWWPANVFNGRRRVSLSHVNCATNYN